MRWSFPAVPESVAQARSAAREVAARYGADDGVLASMVLCVSEAVTNAVVHAYHDRSPGEVEFEANQVGGFLCLYVRDSGRGMRPRPDSPGAGFGLPLISRLATEMSVSSRDGGTEMVMRFNLAER